MGSSMRKFVRKIGSRRSVKFADEEAEKEKQRKKKESSPLNRTSSDMRGEVEGLRRIDNVNDIDTLLSS